ncbi:hypothetical protein Tco_1416405 [Tanacetum coccineum]
MFWSIGVWDRLGKMIKRVFGLAYFTDLLAQLLVTPHPGLWSVGVGRDQQLPPGLPEGVPRHGGSHSADWKIQATEEEIKKLDEEIRSLRTVETEVHGLRNRTQNLETLLEAEVDMKKVAEAKSVDLASELESLRAQFSDLQVNNHQLSQQVSTYTIMLSLTMAFKPTYTIID